ncbi:hypothetical protein PV11_04991 [Exophiala sideris]|uniref:CENP-V/GFA domain-containing protein n=1 Tax=Exophiala sideris TaxID=1016849 RepID=A0A0D1X5E8_9EURO|nr:hypothetical protein PV11_04991 [Exophiala sideris]
MMKGSCLCGKVTFNLDIDPAVLNHTQVCHCRPCRKITGATTSLNLTVSATAFVLKSGNLKTVTTKHIDEGFEYSLSFCEDCGSPIYAVPQSVPDKRVMQVGTLDDIELLEQKPTAELNVKHRLGWVGQIDGAEQKEKYV